MGSAHPLPRHSTRSVGFFFPFLLDMWYGCEYTIATENRVVVDVREQSPGILFKGMSSSHRVALLIPLTEILIRLRKTWVLFHLQHHRHFYITYNLTSAHSSRAHITRRMSTHVLLFTESTLHIHILELLQPPRNWYSHIQDFTLFLILPHHWSTLILAQSVRALIHPPNTNNSTLLLLHTHTQLEEDGDICTLLIIQEKNTK